MTDYTNMTTADLLRLKRSEPAAPELTRAAAMRMQRSKYEAMRKSGMAAAEMCKAMTDDELDRNARKGGLAAIEEQKRRRPAPAARTAAAIMAVFKPPTILVQRAEILGKRYADRVMPDHDLDLGV